MSPTEIALSVVAFSNLALTYVLSRTVATLAAAAVVTNRNVAALSELPCWSIMQSPVDDRNYFCVRKGWHSIHESAEGVQWGQMTSGAGSPQVSQRYVTGDQHRDDLPE